MFPTVPRFHAVSALALSVFVAGLALGPETSAMGQKYDPSQSFETPRSSDSELSGMIIRDPEASKKAAKEVAKLGPIPVEFEDIRSVGEEIDPPLDWMRLTIKEGSTLSGLFKKAGLNDADMVKVINGSGKASLVEKIYPGEEIAFGLDEQGELQILELQRSPLEFLRVENTTEGFIGQIEQETPDVSRAFASATIDGSLYLAAKKAGMTDKVTMGLADIFAWDIDFVYDIRRGDSFEVLYEELTVDGKTVGTGEILAARFYNKGKEIFAVRHENKDGRAAFYTPEGKSLEKAFLRTPINARVSSPFNLQRRHPVLDYVRPHEGTDYAAPVGTPIKAAGAGKVIFSGWKGGYGRTVILKHGDGITTLYAHMSRIDKSMRNGQSVEQGETIGYLGSSGMVTGPHLHYEFRVNGDPKNSRTVSLPDARPVPASEMAEFKKKVQALSSQIAMFQNEDGTELLSKAGD